MFSILYVDYLVAVAGSCPELTLHTAWSRHEYSSPDERWFPSCRYRRCAELAPTIPVDRISARVLTIPVRTTRARIIYLRNDYKDLMSAIERHLHDHFASLNDDDARETPTFSASELRDSIPETLEQPFAKVNSVVDNSPAETAGLKAGDLIRTFGYVNKENHDNLRRVAQCVQGNEGVSPACPIAACWSVVMLRHMDMC